MFSFRGTDESESSGQTNAARQAVSDTTAPTALITAETETETETETHRERETVRR